MTRKLLMGIVAVAAVASVWGACKKDETTSGTGGSGNTTTTTTTTTAAGGGGMGGTASGGGGSGGAVCPCETCGSYVAACAGGTCPPEQDICGYTGGGGGGSSPSPSEVALLSMQTCVCTNCINDCQNTCGQGGADTANCLTCQITQLGTNCSTQYAACNTDPCAP